MRAQHGTPDEFRSSFAFKYLNKSDIKSLNVVQRAHFEAQDPRKPCVCLCVLFALINNPTIAPTYHSTSASLKPEIPSQLEGRIEKMQHALQRLSTTIPLNWLGDGGRGGHEMPPIFASHHNDELDASQHQVSNTSLDATIKHVRQKCLECWLNVLPLGPVQHATFTSSRRQALFSVHILLQTGQLNINSRRVLV